MAVPFLSLALGDDRPDVEAAIRRVLESRLVHPRTRGRGLRGGVRGGVRRGARGRRQHRDRCADADPARARHRARRRGHHDTAHGGVHRAGDPDDRRDAGFRGHRPRTRDDRSGRGRRRCHVADARADAGAPLWSAGGHDGADGDRLATWPCGDRRLRAGASRDVRRPAGGHHRHRRRVQLLPDEESRSARRRRRRRDQRHGAGRPDCAAQKRRPGRALPPCRGWRELAPRRAAGGHPARAAAASCRMDGGAPASRRRAIAPRWPAPMSWCRRSSTSATSITSSRCAAAGATRFRRRSRRVASARSSTTLCPSAVSLRSRTSHRRRVRTLTVSRRRSCLCRSRRRSTDTDVDEVASAVGAAAANPAARRSRHDSAARHAAALRLPAGGRDAADSGGRPLPAGAPVGRRAGVLGHRPQRRLVAQPRPRAGAAPRLHVAAAARGQRGRRPGHRDCLAPAAAIRPARAADAVGAGPARDWRGRAVALPAAVGVHHRRQGSRRVRERRRSDRAGRQPRLPRRHGGGASRADAPALLSTAHGAAVLQPALHGLLPARPRRRHGGRSVPPSLPGGDRPRIRRVGPPGRARSQRLRRRRRRPCAVFPRRASRRTTCRRGRRVADGHQHHRGLVRALPELRDADAGAGGGGPAGGGPRARGRGPVLRAGRRGVARSAAVRAIRRDSHRRPCGDRAAAAVDRRRSYSLAIPDSADGAAGGVRRVLPDGRRAVREAAADVVQPPPDGDRRRPAHADARGVRRALAAGAAGVAPRAALLDAARPAGCDARDGVLRVVPAAAGRRARSP